jgi:hypothetical protein
MQIAGQDSTGKPREVRTDTSGHLDIVGTITATVDTTLLATEAKQDSAITLLGAGLPASLGGSGGLRIESASALEVSDLDVTTATELIASRLAAAPTASSDFGTATKALVVAGAAKLTGFIVANNEATVYYFQVHNKTTAPAATDVPVLSLQMPAGSMLAVGAGVFSGGGLAFALGIGWAWSSTAGTFTDAGTANLHSTTVLYTP